MRQENQVSDIGHAMLTVAAYSSRRQSLLQESKDCEGEEGVWGAEKL